jgi:hypothetical protein
VADLVLIHTGQHSDVNVSDTLSRISVCRILTSILRMKQHSMPDSEQEYREASYQYTLHESTV